MRVANASRDQGLGGGTGAGNRHPEGEDPSAHLCLSPKL